MIPKAIRAMLEGAKTLTLAETNSLTVDYRKGYAAPILEIRSRGMICRVPDVYGRFKPCHYFEDEKAGNFRIVSPDTFEVKSSDFLQPVYVYDAEVEDAARRYLETRDPSEVLGKYPELADRSDSSGYKPFLEEPDGRISYLARLEPFTRLYVVGY